MSMKECRECNGDVSSEAEKCPHCGIKNPSRSKNFLSQVGNVIGGLVGIFVVFAILGSLDSESSAAICSAKGESLMADVFLINGEPDAGYLYKINAENAGEAGEVSFKVHLTSSEGAFTREQTFVMNAGERRNLSFSFHEPSINATNVQGSFSCTPGS